MDPPPWHPANTQHIHGPRSRAYVALKDYNLKDVVESLNVSVERSIGRLGVNDLVLSVHPNDTTGAALVSVIGE